MASIIWKQKIQVNEHNKGILLSPLNIDGLKITANIHHTDTVTVTVACSKNPVSTAIDDVNGIIRLAAALARTQERIQRIADECGQSLPGGYENILIPDSGILELIPRTIKKQTSDWHGKTRGVYS